MDLQSLIPKDAQAFKTKTIEKALWSALMANIRSKKDFHRLI